MFSATSRFIISLPDVLLLPSAGKISGVKFLRPTSPQVDFFQRAECKHRRHSGWGKKGVSVELACLIEINLASRRRVLLCARVDAKKRGGWTRRFGNEWENGFPQWGINQAASPAIRDRRSEWPVKKILLDNRIHFSSLLESLFEIKRKKIRERFISFQRA